MMPFITNETNSDGAVVGISKNVRKGLGWCVIGLCEHYAFVTQALMLRVYIERVLLFNLHSLSVDAPRSLLPTAEQPARRNTDSF